MTRSEYYVVFFVPAPHRNVRLATLSLCICIVSGFILNARCLTVVFLFLPHRYDFNDSNVSPTTPERAVSPSAYVLFYKRR